MWYLLFIVRFGGLLSVSYKLKSIEYKKLKIGKLLSKDYGLKKHLIFLVMLILN